MNILSIAKCNSIQTPSIRQTTSNYSLNVAVFYMLLYQSDRIHFVQIRWRNLKDINIYVVINADNDNLCNLSQRNGFDSDLALFYFNCISQYLLK